MKPDLKALAAMTLLPLLASCSESPGLCPPDFGLIPAFSVFTEATPDTKNMMGEAQDGEYPILWNVGDRLAVAGDPSDEAASIFSTADDNSATATFCFDKTINGNAIPSYRGRMWLAFYPADSYSYAGKEHTLRLQSEQTYSPDGFGNGAMPMFASSTDRNLQFRNVCGIFRLRLSTLDEDAEIISVKVRSSVPMTGKFLYSPEEDSFVFHSSEEDEGIRLDCPEAIRVGTEPTDFCIVLPPGQYEDFTIHLTSANGRNRTFKASEVVSIGRSRITTIALDLAQFTDSGTEDIEKGDDNSALTSLEYGFSGPAANIWILRKKKKGTINLRSFKNTEFADGMSSAENIPWSAVFSTDGGASWSSEIPSLFNDFTIRGEGSADGETLTYSAVPGPSGTSCIVKLVQERSGKSIPINFSWRSNVIEATYEPYTDDINKTLFNVTDDNVDYVLYDTGQEIKVRPGTREFVTKLNGAEPRKIFISVRDNANTLKGLFQTTYPRYRNLAMLDFSNADLTGMEDLSCLCKGCNYLEEVKIDFKEYDTESLRNVSSMFERCSKLATINLSGLNTENVTDMSRWFSFCRVIKELNASELKTSNVTNMSKMFEHCPVLEELDVSGFDTGNVTDMSFMFYECTKLQSLDVSRFKTDKVTDMSFMFYECNSLLALDVSGFDTGQCRKMNSMFYKCNNLTEIDVSRFSTDIVTTMEYMFRGCSNVEHLDVSGFNTAKVTDMSGMFCFCSKLKSLDISGFNYTSLEYADEMFYYCTALKQVDIPNFDAPLLKNASKMFYESGVESIRISDFRCGDGCKLVRMFSCSFLKDITLENFDARKATDMNSMFMRCDKLEALDLSQMYTEAATDMNSMFFNSGKIKTLIMSNTHTSNVTDMSFMFAGCSALKRLDLSSFDTRKVSKMHYMFSYCESLEELDIPGFSTPELTSITAIFNHCYALKAIDMSGFQTEQVTYLSELFDCCYSLVSVDISNFSGKNALYAGSMFRNCTNLKSIDMRNLNLGNLAPDNGSTYYSYGAISMFENCRSLETVYMDLTGKTDYSVYNMFRLVPGPLTLYVKDGQIDDKIRQVLPAQCSVIPL